MAKTLTQDLITLRKLKREASELDKRQKEAAKLAKALEIKVFERMEQDEVDSVKAAGSNFVRAETVFASIQDREAFLDWAKSNDESLVKETEESALLNQLVREKLDNGETLPDGVGFYARRYVAVRAG